MKAAALTLTFAISFAYAKSQTWHYGMKTGLNYARLLGTGVSSRLNYNFQGGFFAERAFSKKWSIQSEILYNQNTYQRSDDFLKYYPNSGKYNSRESIYLSYLTVPVLLKHSFNKYISIHGGVQYGVRVLSNENLLKNNLDAFGKNEFGLSAGTEAAPLNFLSIYVRYTRGITDVNNIDARYGWRAERIETGIAVNVR